LHWRHFHAVEYHGTEASFEGRIALDRGAGVVEFPDAHQLRGIAAQEGVPEREVDKAFGHLAERSHKSMRKNPYRERPITAQERHLLYMLAQDGLPVYVSPLQGFAAVAIPLPFDLKEAVEHIREVVGPEYDVRVSFDAHPGARVALLVPTGAH
jgi:hypothetical protein